MRSSHEITEAEFNSLLRWLDQDDERAGERYEAIRRHLIQVFINRGCPEAEDLADETINRVAKKLKDANLADTYEGDPARYFYGVAKNVLLEAQRKARPRPAKLAEPDLTLDPYLEALDRCLSKLTVEDRELILSYYEERKQEKINSRKALLSRLSLNPGALRARTHRIRAKLEKCVREELTKLDEGEGKRPVKEID